MPTQHKVGLSILAIIILTTLSTFVSDGVIGRKTGSNVEYAPWDTGTQGPYNPDCFYRGVGC